MLAACSEVYGSQVAADDLDLVSSGALTVCSDVPNEPFGFQDPDSPTGYSGFDIDVVTAIADRLDLAVEVVPAAFEDLVTGTAMAAGTCDVAASAIMITARWAQQVDLTDPYYDVAQSLLVLEDAGLSSIDDLVDGKVVGVQSGTTGQAYAEQHVPGAEIRVSDTIDDLVIALETGQVDAILHDRTVAVDLARGNAAVVVEDYDSSEAYGFAVVQAREDGFVAAINAALAEIREDGTYDELLRRYFGVD